MLNGNYRGKPIGSGTDVWRFSEEVKAGRMTPKEFFEAESCMSRSSGTCMVMGTASTMASDGRGRWASALPQNAAIPAVDSRRYAHGAPGRAAHRRPGAGRRADLADPHARGVRERDSRERRRRRLDQRGDSPAGDGRPHRRAAHARRLGHARQERAHARRPDAVRTLPDGGLLLRGRRARGDAQPRRARPAAPRRAHGQRPDDVGEHQGRAELEHRGDSPVRQAAGQERRHRGAARQPRPGRRGAEALGGLAAPDEASRPGRRVRDHRALPGAHQRPRARRRRQTRSWCSRTAGRTAIRAWRRSGTWACRRKS